VPALDQCQVLFSPALSVIYSVSLEQETEEDTAFESSFKTLDAYDYSSIGKFYTLYTMHYSIIVKENQQNAQMI
jgi:hypothetical protein